MKLWKLITASFLGLIPEGAGFGINSIDSYPSKHLLPVIYKTSSGCILNESIPLVGTGSANSDDMLTLAIKISIDKTIKVSIHLVSF